MEQSQGVYLFISDIHLGLEEKEREEKKERLLEKFLKEVAPSADALFINGDLYDYWFEYKRVYQKGYFRTLTALQDLTSQGVKVYYVIGNHDFMHRDFFRTEIGVELIEDSLDIRLLDKRFFIAHGDGYVPNDEGYRLLKMILRNRFFQWLFSLLHPDFAIRLASGTSKSSRAYTSKKDYGESDGLGRTAQSMLEKGFDYVLFGHSHRTAKIQFGAGWYINLGSWLEQPCYGRFSGGHFEIVKWE